MNLGATIGMNSVWLLEVGQLSKWFSWAHLFFGIQYLRAALQLENGNKEKPIPNAWKAWIAFMFCLGCYMSIIAMIPFISTFVKIGAMAAQVAAVNQHKNKSAKDI